MAGERDVLGARDHRTKRARAAVTEAEQLDRKAEQVTRRRLDENMVKRQVVDIARVAQEPPIDLHRWVEGGDRRAGKEMLRPDPTLAIVEPDLLAGLAVDREDRQAHLGPVEQVEVDQLLNGAAQWAVIVERDVV